jgi:hemophore-related protein
MVRLSLTKLTVAVGGAAIALTAGSGIASADPLDPVINTTCNYGQVMAALHDYNAGHWAQFNASPLAQSYLRNFLASPPGKRAQMAAQIQAMPQAAAYLDDVVHVAGTCNGYDGNG